MIVTTKVTHGMLVTICNYDLYQDPKTYEGNNEGRTKVTANEQRRERQGNNINNNDKNDKNVKNEESVETALKSAYGRKGNVLLTDAEYQGIKDRFVDYDGLINHVGDYLANSRHYDDHEALIFKIGTQDKWAVKAQVKSQELSQEEIDRMRAEQWGQDWKN
jgi:hypothetical protein